MYLEKVKEIREVEDALEKSKAEARAEAQALSARAEADGKALLERTRADARAALKDALYQAEQTAERDRSAVKEHTAAACEALRREAEQHMAAAVAEIVRRVVDA